MFSKILLIIVVVAITSSQALPIWINGFGYPTFIHQTPSIAMGFGSGFSSNINGIRHSSGHGFAFSNGRGQAYGIGTGTDGSATGIGTAFADGGQNFGTGAGDATGLGMTGVVPTPYNVELGSNEDTVPYNYPIFLSPIQGYQSAVAQTQNGLQYGLAMSENSPNHQLAISSNIGRNGMSSANSVSSGNFQSASALASSSGANGFSSSVSAAQNLGGSKVTMAHTTQFGSGSLQHSGTTAIDAPGVLSSDAHSVRLG